MKYAFLFFLITHHALALPKPQNLSLPISKARFTKASFTPFQVAPLLFTGEHIVKPKTPPCILAYQFKPETDTFAGIISRQTCAAAFYNKKLTQKNQKLALATLLSSFSPSSSPEDMRIFLCSGNPDLLDLYKQESLSLGLAPKNVLAKPCPSNSLEVNLAFFLSLGQFQNMSALENYQNNDIYELNQRLLKKRRQCLDASTFPDEL